MGFEVDLTEHLIKGENILALRVDHTNFKTGRWYTGSGIYRNAWLKVKPQVHIENWGVAFESTKHDDQSSNYSVEVSIENHTAESTSGIVRSALFDAENQVVASLSSPYELHAGSNTIETLLVV